MKTMRKSAASVLCLMALGWGATVAGAMTLTVDCAGGGDYLTMQAAVDAAASGDTIAIAPCVYNERVEIIDKVLCLQGSGADVTELRWGGELEPLYIDTPTAAGEHEGTVSGLTIVREPARLPAVTWTQGGLVLEDCVVRGGALSAFGGWDTPPPSISIHRCDLDAVAIHGSGRYSFIGDSHIGSASFSGFSLYSGAYHYHYLTSVGSEYGTLSVSICSADMTDDRVGLLEATPLCECVAVDSWFGGISAECGYTRLTHCTVEGPIDVWGEAFLGCEYCGGLKLTDCLVHGVVGVDINLGGWTPGQSSLRLVNNTFLGSLYCAYSGGSGFVTEAHVKNNIVMGMTIIGGDAIDATYNTAFVHNDFLAGAWLQAYVDSIFGNFSEDPLFCGEGEYTLEECSPCVGSGLDGADVGAFGVACECSTPVEEVTWGRIKNIFR